jgi:hypothetical protein
VSNISTQSWRSRTIARLLSILAVVAGLLGTATIQAMPASADATCYGDYCSGKDPVRTGCDAGARTVAWEDLTGARLEVRWSDKCQTNWARYQQYPRGWYFGNVPLELRAVQDTGYTQRLGLGVNGVADNETKWSPMIYSPVKRVRAEVVFQCSGVGDCLVSGAITGEAIVRTGWA